MANSMYSLSLSALIWDEQILKIMEHRNLSYCKGLPERIWISSEQ